MAGLARTEQQERAERLYQPGVAGQHSVQAGGHLGGRVPPAQGSRVGQRDLVPHLVGRHGIKPEIRAAADTEPPADHAQADFGLLPGGADQYIITSGALKGAARFLHP